MNTRAAFLGTPLLADDTTRPNMAVLELWQPNTDHWQIDHLRATWYLGIPSVYGTSWGPEFRVAGLRRPCGWRMSVAKQPQGETQSSSFAWAVHPVAWWPTQAIIDRMQDQTWAIDRDEAVRWLKKALKEAIVDSERATKRLRDTLVRIES